MCTWKNIVGVLLLSLLALAAQGPAANAQVLHFFEMALDADNSTATGCDFVVTDAGLPGVADPGYEVLLTLTVDSSLTPPMVVAAESSLCNGVSGNFEFTDALPGTPWPVGLNNGELGSDVIEGFLPLDFLTADEVRLAFRSLSNAGSEDALITTGGSSAEPPILLTVATIVEIPTLSAVGFVLLVLVLAGAAVVILRRRRSTLVLTLIFLVFTAGLLYAAVPDGMIGEWMGSAPIAMDLVPDSLPVDAAAEIVAAFASANGADLCMRLDIVDLENSPLVAMDDIVTVDEDSVSAMIDVLANDMDPDPGDTLTIIQVDSPTVAGGTAIIDPLAAPNNQILYTPPADFAGPDSFGYTVEESGGGLTDMAMVIMTVAPVNDAPVLDNTGTMVFTAIDEDAVNPMGDLVSGLIASAGGDRITDIDAGSVEGLAVIARDNTDGTWEFSTNGGGVWTPFGALSSASATVLSATAADRIRFVPAANFNGTVDPGISFRAWDTTSGELSGAAGVDTTTNGGITAFSTAIETAAITVNAVNDPPVKTAGGGGPAAFTEDGGAVAVDPGLTVTDLDNANLASATVTISNLLDAGLETLAATASGAIGAGDINYAAPTLTIAPVGGAPVADFQAVLRSVTYDNTSQSPDETDRTLNCVANDGTDDSNTLAQTVTVAAENDAPVLDNLGAMVLTAIDEDTANPAGDQVSAIIASAGGDRITDVDGGAVEGLAVTGRDNTNGVWEFSTDGGGTWTAFGALSDANATVLSATAMDRVRFVPAANFNGLVDPGITFRAWDTTSGESSGTPAVDATTNGGVTAFSTATETAAITVNAVNDPPVKTAGGGGPAAFIEGMGPVVVDPGVTVTDVDNANLASATVTITNLLDVGMEVLAASPSGAIGAGEISFAAPTLTIAPVGGAPVADFQAVLRSVTYDNSSMDPDETNRTLNCVANDGAANSNTLAQTVTVTAVNAPPTAGIDAYDTVGNTELVVGTGGPAAVSLATVALAGASVLDNDSDPEGTAVTVVSVGADATGPTFDGPSTLGGAVSMDASGRFTYLPPRGMSNVADSFTYGVEDADGVGAIGTVNITVINFRVWYVHNDPAGEPLNPLDGPNFGRSDDPFDTLAAAGTAHGAGDLICVYRGDGTTAGMNAGITLAASNVTLHGEHQGCQVNQSLNGQPAPEVLLAPTANSHARLGHTAGNAISVDATGGNVTGIEIRGVDLSATGGNGLDVTSSGANDVGVLFENSRVSGASGEGIDVNHASSGLATVTVNALSSLVATGNGFDARTTGAGNLEVAFDGVAGITSGNGGGSAVFMEDTSGTGTFFVTSFSGNAVLGSSAGEGVRILGAIFDSDPADADFDLVAGGNLDVGIVSNRVGTGGVVLGTPANRVLGNLSFGTLNIFTTAGAALSASGAGLSTGGPPPTAGFLLAVATGVADAIGGPALALDPLSASVQLATVSSVNSPTSGVSLVDVAGTVTLAAGGLTNSTAATFSVTGGTVSSTYSGSITQANNAPAVSVSGGHSAGTVVFEVGTISATAGTGLQFDNADGNYDFNGTTTLSGGDAGVDIVNDSSGTFDFVTNATITNPTGTGFNINNSSPTLDYNGTITDNTGLAVDIVTLGAGGSVRFDGQVTASGGGLRMAGAASTVLFANADLTSSATIDIDNNTAVITFSDLSLDQTAGTVNAFDVAGGNANIATTLTGNGIRSSTANRLVDITARAGGTVSFSGAATLQGTGVSTGINISGATVANTVTFAGAVDLGTSAANRITGGGVNMSGNVANTSVSFNSLDIFANGVTGIAATGSGTLDTTTLAGLVNIDTTGTGAPALDLDGIVSTVTIDGAVCNNNSTCIDLTNLAATSVTRLAGLGLTCSAGTCFNASGAQTVEVTGAGNTVAATGGTGVSMQGGTTLGAANATFESIAVNGMFGANPGIRLADTGAGDFVVTGDGTTTAGGNASGGTIQDITGSDAIILDNTGGLVSFQNMIIEDIADANDAADAVQTRRFRDGIHGENVGGGLRLQSVTMRRFSDHAILGALFSDGTDFTNWNGLELRDSLFENSNRFHVPGRGDDADEGMIRIRGLTGTMVVDNCTVRLGARGLDIYTPAGAGTLDATLQRNIFEDIYKEFASGGTRNVGGRGVSFEARGSHDMVVRIGDPAQLNAALGNTFTNNLTASIAVVGQEGGGFPHTGDIDTVISRNTFTITDHTTAQLPPGNLTFDFPQGGVALVPAGGTYDAIVSFNTFDEVMHAAGGLGQLTLGLNGGAVQAHVHDNTFRLPWDGSVQIRAESTTSAAVLFEDNTYVDGTVGSASDDVGFAAQSPFNPVLVNVRAGGNLDLTMRREIFPQHDIVFTPADRKHSVEVEVQADSAANALDLHMMDNQGPEGYHLKELAGSLELFQGASASMTPATILRDNGNRGGGSVDTTDPPTVAVTGGVTATATAPTLPVIVIP